MKRNDFITNHTEEYTDAMTDTREQAKLCEYINPGLMEWYIDGEYIGIKDMTASQLFKVSGDIQDMVSDLLKLANLVSAMATAKEKLEEIDLYEFDD